MVKVIKTSQGSIYYSHQIKKVKNINFRIKPDGIVYISSPKGISESFIQNIIIKNQAQIIATVKKLTEKTGHIDEDKFWLLGKAYPIKYIASPQNCAKLKNNCLLLYSENKENARALMHRLYNEKINEVYPMAFEEIYNLLKADGIPYPSKITPKKMKSRWGSCSLKTMAISLNSELIKYPPNCLKYVILHELAHFRHRGHNSGFYAYVSHYMADYKKYENILKKPYYEVTENE